MTNESRRGWFHDNARCLTLWHVVSGVSDMPIPEILNGLPSVLSDNPGQAVPLGPLRFVAASPVSYDSRLVNR